MLQLQNNALAEDGSIYNKRDSYFGQFFVNILLPVSFQYMTFS